MSYPVSSELRFPRRIADSHQGPEEGDRGRLGREDIVEVSVDERYSWFLSAHRRGCGSISLPALMTVKKVVVTHICLTISGVQPEWHSYSYRQRWPSQLQ
jgi:hypothetical protein